MNFKTTLTLLVSLLLLGGVLMYVRREKSDEPETPKERKLIEIDAKDVVGLTIVADDGKRRSFEQSGMSWKMTEPISAPAEISTVDSLVRALTDLKSHGVVEAGGDNSKATGLDKPRFTVEIKAKDNKSAKLKVGQPSSIGANVYVLVNDDPKPRLVAVDLSDQLDKPYTSFRQTKLVNVAPQEIRQIEISKPDAPKMVLRKTGEAWKIIEPVEMPGDANEIPNLAVALASLGSTGFVEKAPPLMRPTMTVWFSTEAPSTQPSTQPSSRPVGTTITFQGYENVLKKNVYVSVSDPPTLAKVMASSLDAIDKKSLDLRDRTVLKIDPATVDSISLVIDKPATTQPTTRPAQQATLMIERNKNALPKDWHAPMALPEPTTGPATTQSVAASTEPATKPVLAKWEITTGTRRAADETVVDALLVLLNPLKAEKFVDSPPTTQPADQYTLTIVAAGATHTITIRDPGAPQSPVGSYGDLSFEIGRPALDALNRNFEPGSGSAPAP